MNDKLYMILVGILISAISILSVFLFQAVNDRATVQAETGMSAPDMLAVTGRVGSNTSVLYVIDTKKKSLAVYSAFGAKRVRFIGARRIKYDFELISFHDNTEKAYRVEKLGEQYRKATQKDDGKKKRRRKR